MKHLPVVALFLLFHSFFQNEALAKVNSATFSSDCKIISINKNGNTQLVRSELKFMVSNDRGAYFEILSCSSDCISERVYLGSLSNIVSVHKHNASIIEKNILNKILTIIYEGSDPGHLRKIKLDMSTGDINIFEYGKTIASRKDFHEENKSKCEIHK